MLLMMNGDSMEERRAIAKAKPVLELAAFFNNTSEDDGGSDE